MNREQIDELFAGKIGNMEITPPKDSWRRIEAELNRNNRSSRKFWLAAASIALLLSTAATVLYLTQTGSQDIVVTGEAVGVREAVTAQPISETATVARQSQSSHHTSDSFVPEQSTPSRTPANLSGAEQNSAVHAQEQHETSVFAASNPQQPEDGKITTRDMLSSSSIPVYHDVPETAPDMRPVHIRGIDRIPSKLPTGISLPHLTATETDRNRIAASNIPVYDIFVDTEDIKASKHGNKWEVAGQFAPNYSYRTITDVPGNMRRSDFDNAESALLAYTGGVKVSYVVSRFSIQTGVYYTQMGQAINHVTPVNNMYAAISSNTSYAKNFVRTSSGNITVSTNLKSSDNNNYANYFTEQKSTASTGNMSLMNRSSNTYRMVERVEYIEIPVLLRYKLIDRKLSFALLGGMSTNILVNNNVFIDNGSELIKDGSMLMVRPVNYNGTVGMGLTYKVSKNLHLALEPQFKYFIHSYTSNNPISNNPYSIAIFTGVVYLFQ
ncbi:MAG: PorT family protein [Bacteroidales bacterium]|jgi:hypothetical protein|nr:PorT family protein [Bacteroidales bacterium]